MIQAPIQRRRLLLLLLALLLAPLACGDSDDGGTGTGPDPRRAVNLTIEPSFVQIDAIGDTVRLTAVVLDQFGDPIETATITWSSLGAAVATVDSEGRVVSKGAGTGRIVASSGSLSDEIAVLVSPVVASLTLSTQKETIAEGESVQLAVVAKDSKGTEIPNIPVTWVTSDEKVAVVDASGRVTGVWGEGSVTITAAAGGKSATAEVFVLGKIAFLRNPEGIDQLHVMNTDGSDVQLLAALDAINSRPSWSPDGKRITFAGGDGGATVGVYTMNADGSMIERITPDAINATNPVFSPDGKKIAFVSDRDGSLDVYTMNADGTDIVNLTSHPSSDHFPEWSPDGSKLLFVSEREGNPALYVMSAEGSGTPARLTPTDMGSLYNPAWSPDGRMITVTVEKTGAWEIWVMEFNGSNPRKLTGIGEHAAGSSWTQDGRIIDSSNRESRDSNRLDIFIMDVDGSNVTRLTHTEWRNVGPAWKPGPPES